MLGIKLRTDASINEQKSFIDYALNEQLGLEIALSNKTSAKDAEETFKQTNFYNISNTILHLDNKKFFGFEIDKKETYDHFAYEMQFVKNMDIKKTVMHYSDTMKKADATDDKLKQDLIQINNLSANYSVITHIENTLFEKESEFTKDKDTYINANVDFFERLFKIVREENLKNIGFCFDLGHGKVISSNTIPEWLNFIDNLNKDNISLHFHLHNNEGTDDDHMPFHLADKKGLNEGDNYTQGNHYLDVINYIIKKYNTALQIMETHPQHALDEIKWLKQELPKRDNFIKL